MGASCIRLRHPFGLPVPGSRPSCRPDLDRGVGPTRDCLTCSTIRTWRLGSVFAPGGDAAVVATGGCPQGEKGRLGFVERIDLDSHQLPWSYGSAVLIVARHFLLSGESYFVRRREGGRRPLAKHAIRCRAAVENNIVGLRGVPLQFTRNVPVDTARRLTMPAPWRRESTSRLEAW